MKKGNINAGSACFVVRDGSLAAGADAPFFKWLRQEGFEPWGRKGFFEGVDWVYVNLNSGIYAPGMPGVSIAEPVGGHAISPGEFMTVCRIFKKYQGLDLMRMTLREQEEQNRKMDAAREKFQSYWQSTDFEKYCAAVEEAYMKDSPSESREELRRGIRENIEDIEFLFQCRSSPEQAAYFLFFAGW